MNPKESHYCFYCLHLISTKEVPNHQRLGHEVDSKTQDYYEEIEKAAGFVA